MKSFLRFLFALLPSLLFGAAQSVTVQNNNGAATFNTAGVTSYYMGAPITFQSATFNTVTVNQSVANIVALKAIPITAAVLNGYTVQVVGYYTQNDGGGGTYVWNAASVVSDNGGTVIAPNVGNGRWLLFIPGEWNIRTFGAKGNGVSSDSTAFQAALNAIPAGSTLYVPAGTYVLGTPLSVSGKQIVIRGDGANSVLQGDNDLLTLTNCDDSRVHDIAIQNQTTRWTFDLVNDDGTFKNLSQVLASLAQDNGERFTYSVNFNSFVPGLDAALTTAQKAQFVTAIKFVTSNHVDVNRVYGRFAQIHLFRCNDSTVENCDILGGNSWGTIWFENGGTAGVGINGDLGERNTAQNNRVRWGGYSGVVLMRQHRAMISGNTFYRSGEAGVKTYQNNIVNSRRCYECSIVDNRCIETVFDGIDATADNGSPVERIDDYLLSQAAWFNLPTRHVIQGNYVKYGDILIDGYQTMVQGNSVLLSRTGAIKALGGTAQVVSGNLLWQYNTLNIVSGEHGIGVANGIVMNNTLIQDGSATNGFSISNIGGVSVGNYCKDTVKQPILWTGGGMNWTTQAPNGFGRIDMQVGQSQSYRNLLTNGSFTSWQLGTSFTINGGWYLDGWYYGNFAANRNLSQGVFARDQTAVPGYPSYYLTLGQPVDGQGLGFLVNAIENYGRVSGKVLCFSLWCKASRNLTGADRPTIIFRRNINGAFANAPEQYVLDISGDWQKFTGTFQAPSQDNTVVTTSDCGEFYIALGPATANAYDIEFALVQLEVGMSPSDFEFLPPDVDLQRCQRYVQILSTNSVPGSDLRPSMYKAATVSGAGPYTYQARLF